MDKTDITAVPLGIKLKDTVKVNNLPLPALLNVVQLALDRLSALAQSPEWQNMPPGAEKSAVMSIHAVLLESTQAMLAAAGWSESQENLLRGIQTQGAALAATVTRFEDILDKLGLAVSRPTTH